MANQIESNVIPLPRAETPRSTQPVKGAAEVREGRKLPDDGQALPPEKEEKLTPQKVSEAVSRLNDYVQTIRRELKFSIDEASGRTVITVLDAQTKEVIRQIPPEEVVSLSKNLEKKESAIITAET
ncbi:flagellar protein FlaG [Thiolapillus sp.]